MSALDELLEEVVGKLHALTRDNLLEICDFLKISGDRRAAVEAKSRISLVTHVLKHLEREEVADLNDDGMAELLMLTDKITDLTTGTDSEAAQLEKTVEQAGMQREMEEQRTAK